MAFPLTQEQRAIVEDRGGELLVSAAAGSGKTRVLVERLLDRVTEEKLDIDRFLVITYTKAAAAELRERIVRELTDRLAAHPTDRHLRRQSTLVYQAQISTVHAFCSVLLRENCHLLDLDPDFRLCDEAEGEILMAQVLDDLLEQRYEGLTPDAPFAQLADTLGAGRDDSRMSSIVLDIFRRVQSHADPEGWLEEQKEIWKLEGVGDLIQTPWGALLLEDGSSRALRCRELLEGCLEDCGRDELLAQNYADSIRATVEELNRLSQAKSWDEAAACLPISFPPVGRKRKRKVELTLRQEEEARRLTERVKTLRDRCKKTVEKIAEQLDGTSAQHLEELRLSGPVMEALIDLVLDFQRAFAAEKRKRSLADFSDLEHFAVKLLLDGEGKPTPLAKSWSSRYDEIMVDEYQDTNQVQNAIFGAISNYGRKLVQVGDVKQSIYRFRLADPTIFIGKYHAFGPGEQAQEGESRVRLLSRNFRSRTQVLEGCNDLFRAIMSESLGEMEYTDDQALVPGASFPEGRGYALELDILDLEEEEGADPEEIRPGKALMEARFTARRIRQLLAKPLMIREGGGQRPVRPSDIMVLLRSPGSVLHDYIRAFGEAGIPWSVEGGGEWFETTQVRVALSLLQIVDNPRQDVPLIAALRSPVYGFSPDELARIRAGKEGDFYDALSCAAREGDRQCADFLEQLAQLRFGCTDMTCAQLVWHVFEQTNLLGLFGAMDKGKQRQEDLLNLYGLAKEMENTGCRTLFQFLLRLERLRQSGGKIKSKPGGAQGEGVTVLSIHRSKGLEKPVVFVCGLTKQFNREDLKHPVLFHPQLGIGPKGLDRERRVEYSTLARRAVGRKLEREMLSEEMRLLYVAMTRAQEKLILSVALTEGKKTLSRLADLAGEKLPAELLEQQPGVGHWILLHALNRPEALRCDEIRALGLHPSGGTYGPPWDIRYISAETIARREKRRKDLIPPETREPEEDISEGLRRLTWRYPNPAGIHIPSKLTATQIKGRPMDEELLRDTVQEPGAKAGPLHRPDFIVRERGLTPSQRGTAMHLVMEHLDLGRELTQRGIRAQLEEMVERQLLTPAQRDSIPVASISRFYQSPLGQRLTRASTCQREFKFSLLVDGGDYYPDAAGEEILLQGVVDVWFRDGEGVTVVDFKSDNISPGQEEAQAQLYRPQLIAYANALKKILGEEQLKTVIWFFRTSTAVEL